MQASKIHVGDVVECNRKGRIFTAMVRSKSGQNLNVLPLTKNITYFNINTKDVTAIIKPA